VKGDGCRLTRLIERRKNWVPRLRISVGMGGKKEGGRAAKAQLRILAHFIKFSREGRKPASFSVSQGERLFRGKEKEPKRNGEQGGKSPVREMRANRPGPF